MSQTGRLLSLGNGEDSGMRGTFLNRGWQEGVCIWRNKMLQEQAEGNNTCLVYFSGRQPVLLNAQSYSWLCAWESLPKVLKGPCGAGDQTRGSCMQSTCKVSASSRWATSVWGGGGRNISMGEIPAPYPICFLSFLCNSILNFRLHLWQWELKPYFLFSWLLLVLLLCLCSPPPSPTPC